MAISRARLVVLRNGLFSVQATADGEIVTLAQDVHDPEDAVKLINEWDRHHADPMDEVWVAEAQTFLPGLPADDVFNVPAGQDAYFTSVVGVHRSREGAQEALEAWTEAARHITALPQEDRWATWAPAVAGFFPSSYRRDLLDSGVRVYQTVTRTAVGA